MLVRRVDAGVRVACGFCFVFGTGPHPRRTYWCGWGWVACVVTEMRDVVRAGA